MTKRPRFPTMLRAASHLAFLSLKNGDIVQVTMDRESTGLEVFRHLSRANGSAPRKQVGFSDGSWGVW